MAGCPAIGPGRNARLPARPICLTVLLACLLLCGQMHALADSSCGEGVPWETVPYVVGAAGLIYAHDRQIRDWAQEVRNPTTDSIANAVRPFGSFEFMVVPLGLAYVTGAIADDTRLARTARISLTSAVTAGAITQVLKQVIGRERPDQELANRTRATRNPAFPSGHATVALAIATVWASEYGGVVAPIAYTLASLTAWSRVNDNVHWASDVFFGAFVGHYTARAFLGSSSDGGAAAVPPPVAGLALGFAF